MSFSQVQADTTVFLSHSHKDKNLVIGLINYLGEKGIKVYVDWNDTNMPRITNNETATRIKKKIARKTLFWVLATDNAMNSKWVPWETGVADQSKKHESIGVIPVEDASGRFDGTEYLQLYRRIIIADNGSLAAFRPSETRGSSLSNFTKYAYNL